MPIHLGKDSEGPFVQWGHQKKYYYKAGDKKSLAAARSRAKKQMKAIFSSGYIGQSANKNDTICHDCGYEFNWETQVDQYQDENGQLVFKCPQCGSEDLRQLEIQNVIPQYLYHATYRPLLRKIKQLGLGNTKRTYWQDSKPGVVYLADDPDVAESYAECNENLRNEDWLDQIIIFKIDTKLLDKSKLFVDQNVKLDEGQTNSTWEYHGIIPYQNLKLINKNILYQGVFNYQTWDIYHKEEEEQLAKGREENVPLEKMDENKLIQLKNYIYKYFGNCINTVDIDRMWDATSMANFILSCKLIPLQLVKNKLYNGQRNIPKKLLNHLQNNPSQLAVAIDNWKQNIMFIYDSIDDIHYFFDIKTNNAIQQSKFNKLYDTIMESLNTDKFAIEIIKRNQKNIYYHISSQKFDKFLIDKCGSGMNTSFWGYRIYFAKNEETINYYYDQMKDSYQHLYKYTVSINCKTINDVWKDYRQNHIPQNKNQKLIYKEDDLLADDKTAGQIYYELAEKYGQKKATEIILNKYHVAGISYYTEQDGNSLVVYDQNIIKILNVQEMKDEEK